MSSFFFPLSSSPYHSRPISVITPPVSPPPEQDPKQGRKDTPESDTERLETQEDGSLSSEDYIVPQSDVNTKALKTFSIKPQTNQHKFLVAGLSKPLSSGNSFAQKRETPNDENPRTCSQNLGDFSECELVDTTSSSKETGVDNTQLPDVKVDDGCQIDDNIENLFNV